MLFAGLASPRVLLLSVRQTELTLDSCSDLLFSLDSVPKPNFLRSEEVLEVIEAELTDRALLCGLYALSLALCSSSRGSPKYVSGSSTNRSMRAM